MNSAVSNTAEYQILGGHGISGSADQDISFFNFGGTFFTTPEYLFPGTWDTSSDWGGVTYVPAVDGVQEFKIQTNAFTAQYGWSNGNVINVVTKSGNNRFHGDAYEFYRNSALDSRNFFNNGKAPDFHRHQFGGTFGGPIIKNKTYFFAYYEGLRQQTPVTFTGSMPLVAFRSGDFSSLLGGPALNSAGQPITDNLGRTVLTGSIYDPFSTRTVTAGQVDPTTGLTATNTGYVRDPFQGNLIPTTRWDPIANNILQGNFWPKADTTDPFNNYSRSAAAAAHSNEYSIRIDHNISDKSRLFGRWSQKYESKVNVPEYYGSDVGGPGATNPNNRYSFDLGYSHVFTPTFLLSANVGVNRWVEGSQVQSLGFKASTLGLPSFIDAISPVFPQVQPQGMSSLGPNPNQDDYFVPRTLWTGSVDLTKIKGRHNLSFGFMGVLNQIDAGHIFNTTLKFPTSFTPGPDPNNIPQGANTGFGFASFLLGVGDSGSQTGVNALPATEKKQLGWYLQDDWHASRKLTLNLGLRYEIQTAPTERYNRQEYFDFKATNPISAAIGFNVPGELVFNSDINRGLYNTPPKTELIDFTDVWNHGVPVLAQYLEWNQLPTKDLPLGTALQDQVPNPFFGHITSSGCGLDLPTVARGQLLRPYPEYCSVTEAPPAVGSSNYNALQATYTHRWHSGLNVNVSYTFSKFMDDVQGSSGWAFPGSGSSVRDSYNLSREWSVDTSDTPHSLVVNYIYELPFGHGKAMGSNWIRPVNTILGGWQLTGILTAKSGFPLSISPVANNSDSFGGNQRPDVIGNPVPANQNIHDWINPAAFSQPPNNTFGDAPRTFSNLRSPRYVSWDMGLQKWINVGEEKRLQFRWEMFNALNNPNFFAPDQNLGDASFGTINQAYPGRDMQVALKFYW